MSGQAPLEDDGQIKLHGASIDLASLKIGASGELSGFGTVVNAIENLGIIDARHGKLDLGGAVTGERTISNQQGGHSGTWRCLQRRR